MAVIATMGAGEGSNFFGDGNGIPAMDNSLLSYLCGAKHPSDVREPTARLDA